MAFYSYWFLTIDQYRFIEFSFENVLLMLQKRINACFCTLNLTYFQFSLSIMLTDFTVVVLVLFVRNDV